MKTQKVTSGDLQPHLLRKRPATLADHMGKDPVPGQAVSSRLHGGTWGEPAWLPWGPGGRGGGGDGMAATSASLLIKEPDWERLCRLSCKTATVKTPTQLASWPSCNPLPAALHTHPRRTGNLPCGSALCRSPQGRLLDQHNLMFPLRASVQVVSLGPDGLQPTRLLCPWNPLGMNTGVGSLSFLQGIFPTQGSNPGLRHCRQILYGLSLQESQG